MDVSPVATDDLAAENETLRARVAALETQLAEQAQRTNAVVARSQERQYWLDRYHVDLNALMALPGMAAMRTTLRAARLTLRYARQAKRRFLG